MLNEGLRALLGAGASASAEPGRTVAVSLGDRAGCRRAGSIRAIGGRRSPRWSGAEHALADDESRVRHTRGKSPRPAATARRRRIGRARTPWSGPAARRGARSAGVCGSGGSRWCRSAAALRSSAGSRRTRRLRRRARARPAPAERADRVDELSRTAVLEAGLRGPEAERRWPSTAYPSATFRSRSSTRRSAARRDPLERTVLGRLRALRRPGGGLRVATPAGTLSLGRAPGSAAGPTCVSCSSARRGRSASSPVTVRCGRSPRSGLRRLAVASFCDGRPRCARSPGRAAAHRAPPLRRGRDRGQPRAAGRLGGGAGAAWRSSATRGRRTWPHAGPAPQRLEAAGAHGRAGAPATLGARPVSRALPARRAARRRRARRDARDGDVLVGAPRLYDAVTTALRESLTAQGTPPLVLCHVSHVYPDRSRRCTSRWRAPQLDDPLAQWHAAKAAASDAISPRAADHPPPRGRTRPPRVVREIGELAIDARAPSRRDSTRPAFSTPASWCHGESETELRPQVSPSSSFRFGANVQPGQIPARRSSREGTHGPSDR